MPWQAKFRCIHRINGNCIRNVLSKYNLGKAASARCRTDYHHYPCNQLSGENQKMIADCERMPARIALTTQYLDVHERNVAVIALNQKENGCFLSSCELSTISSPAFTADFSNRLRNGSLKQPDNESFLCLQDLQIDHNQQIPPMQKLLNNRLLQRG